MCLLDEQVSKLEFDLECRAATITVPQVKTLRPWVKVLGPTKTGLPHPSQECYNVGINKGLLD